MPDLPDLKDPRYRDEIGYFIAYEKYYFAPGEYPEARRSYSRTLLGEVLGRLGKDEGWLRDKTVVSVGCGCSGDLLEWPAAVKIGIDPLLYAYQKLGMLGEDAPGTSRTIGLSMSAGSTPLLDDVADVAVCRNVLDHVPDPPRVAAEVARILRPDGLLFLGVDIGGEPTPDEPSVFHAEEEVRAVLEGHFELDRVDRVDRPYSVNRDFSLRVVGRPKLAAQEFLDKEAVFADYSAHWSGDPNGRPGA